MSYCQRTNWAITKVVALVNRNTDKSAANPIITWSQWMYNEAQFIGSDWLNRVKHLKSPQPELLDESISFLSSNWFASARIRQIGKPMVITEPTVPRVWNRIKAACSACSAKIFLDSSSLSRVRQNGASDNKLCWQGAGLGVEIADFGLN